MVDHSDDELDYEKLSAQVVEGLIATTEGWNRLLAQARELSKQVAAKYDKAAKNAVATKKYFEDVLANAGEARERFTQQLQEAFRTVQQVYEVLPKRIRESLGTLGRNGWYLDPNLPFSALWKITRQLDEGHFDEINEVLTAHYHENADEILVGLCERFPRRKHLFEAAFSACAFNENASHRLGSRGKEMAATGPIRRACRTDKPQVRFMNQRRRVQSLSRRLVS